MSNKTIHSQTTELRWRWCAALDQMLFSPIAAVVSACLTVLIICGCMTHNHYQTNESTSADGTCTQVGEVSIPGSAEQFVYYPIPYASPPNLELGGDANWCKLLEQKADGFRLRNNWHGNSCSVVSWKARGQRIPPPPGAPVPVAEPATLMPPPVVQGAPPGTAPTPGVQLSGPGMSPPPPPPVPYVMGAK